jgi:hypothetical protein
MSTKQRKRHSPEHGVVPATRLLRDGRPRRKIMRQQSPLAARLHHVLQRIEQFPQGVLVLGNVFVYQHRIQQISPFLNRDVGRIRLPHRTDRKLVPRLDLSQ